MWDPSLKRDEHELHQISKEIAWYEEEARKSVSLALQYKLEIGRRLARAKRLLPHGMFLNWAQQEFGWTPRHVQNHLKLAANAKRLACLAPGASLRMALAAIKESDTQVLDKQPKITAPAEVTVVGRPRVYKQIVRQIEQSIRRGKLKPGTQLPPHRELAHHFGASLTEVRQAIKTLHERGRVEAYSGYGTVVLKHKSSGTPPTALDQVTNVGSAGHLAELLAMLEPEIAAQAAVHSQRNDLESMGETLAIMDSAPPDSQAYIDADLDFHLAMAEAVGNPVILSLIDSIVNVLRNKRERVFRVHGGQERAKFHHHQIYDAIKDRDPLRAREAMHQHMLQVREDLQANADSL